MQITTLALGSYQTNCYIVRAEDAAGCAVIDPGSNGDRVLDFLKQEGLSLDAILLTHGHFDHVGAVEMLANATGCPVWMHQGDYSQQKNAQNTFFYPLANCTFPEISFCEHGQKICAGGLCFTVMEVPGHTWGSVCYLCEDAMFSGDTLFAGSCGRTDLPGGDGVWLRRSLQLLCEIARDYRVFPGHGPDTALFHEKTTNPFLQPGGSLFL